MIQLEILGGQLVLSDVARFGVAVREGSLAGVKEAAGLVAGAVRADTPKKTGRAAGAVVVKESQGGKVQTVRYDYRKKEAYYMRFVILGAKAHTIAPRRLTKRGRRTAFKRRFNALRKGGMSEMLAAAEAGAYVFDRTKKRALYINAGGETFYAANVVHPGVKAHRIFSETMREQKDEITATLAKNIDAATRRTQNTSRLSGDDWIRMQPASKIVPGMPAWSPTKGFFHGK